VRFHENVRFEPFSWVAHDFQHSGQLFCNIPDVHTPCRRHLARFSIIFVPWGTHFGPFSARLGASRTENYLHKGKPE
jgi:hypothetical protein